MREVLKSNLSELKTVFDSDANNEYYYRILKNANCHIINNVELARPIFKRSNSTIIWKSESNLELKLFNEIDIEKQEELSANLKEFFKKFKEKISRFRNINEKFADQVIQIPNRNSILVNEENNYIVIVNWGFLEDSPDRKEGVLSNIIETKEHSSILIYLKNKKGQGIPNIPLILETDKERTPSKTNKNGFARFGTLEAGEKFTISRKLENKKQFLQEFICDRRKEYEIEIDHKVKVSIVFKDQEDNFIEVNNYSFQTNQKGKEYLSLKENEKFISELEVEDDTFKVFNNKNIKIFEESIPSENTLYPIKVEIEKLPETPPVFPENINEENSKTFQFKNNFNKSIKGLPVFLTDEFGNTFKETTNNNGEIHISSLKGDNINYSFTRYNKDWKQSINTAGSDYHIIKVKSIFPWLWWILLLILIFLLTCCLFFNCCSKNDRTATNLTDSEIEELQNDNIMLCNTTNESGGEGITENKHYLGKKSGEVLVNYNMETIPDKMEIYYEGKLVATTANVPGNNNGFVGGATDAGCCGSLKFNYNYNKDEYCMVKIIGLDRTVWEYEISCPN